MNTRFSIFIFFLNLYISLATNQKKEEWKMKLFLAEKKHQHNEDEKEQLFENTIRRNNNKI